MIPHPVVEGDDDIAEVVECPWEWEKDEIEQYLHILLSEAVTGIVRNYLAFGETDDWSGEQRDEFVKAIARVTDEYRGMKKMIQQVVRSYTTVFSQLDTWTDVKKDEFIKAIVRITDKML